MNQMLFTFYLFLIKVTDYSLNEDFEPEVIHKKANQNLEYIQELAVRYLKPSTPPPPGNKIEIKM